MGCEGLVELQGKPRAQLFMDGSFVIEIARVGKAEFVIPRGMVGSVDHIAIPSGHGPKARRPSGAGPPPKYTKSCQGGGFTFDRDAVCIDAAVSPGGLAFLGSNPLDDAPFFLLISHPS